MPPSFMVKLASSSADQKTATTTAGKTKKTTQPHRRRSSSSSTAPHPSPSPSMPLRISDLSTDSKLISIRELLARNAARKESRGEGLSMSQLIDTETRGEALTMAELDGSGPTETPSQRDRMVRDLLSRRSPSSRALSGSVARTGSSASDARHALNDLLLKRQSPVASDETGELEKRDAEEATSFTQRNSDGSRPLIHAQLQAMRLSPPEVLAQRSQLRMEADAQERALADLTAKRNQLQADAESKRLALSRLIESRNKSTRTLPQTDSQQAVESGENRTASSEQHRPSDEQDATKKAVQSLLAKRSELRSESAINPATTESRRTTRQGKESRAKSKQALSAMLSSRNVREQASSTASSRTTASKDDSRSNALAQMLARRNGGTESSTTNPATPQKQADQAKENGKQALSAMLSGRIRSGDSSTSAKPQTSSGGSAQASRTNLLAQMLSSRTGSAESTRPAEQSPASASKEPDPETTEASAMNPLAALLAKRQAASSVAAPTAEASVDDDHLPLNEHPLYASYFKMLKFGHPTEVVKHAMKRDGVDPRILKCDPSKPLPKVLPSDDDGSNDPEYQAALLLYNEKMPTYNQMVKMGLPRGAIEHKMKMDGVDVTWLDGPPRPKSQVSEAAILAAHREKFKKYFDMLQMGLPRGAVEHKMRMDDVNPCELDGPAELRAKGKPTASQQQHRVIKKQTSIRKKLHWEVKRQDSRSTMGESLWSSWCGDTSSQVKVSKESREMLEKLFVKDVVDKKPAGQSGKAGGKNSKEQPRTMFLIDMKKSQNIAITLARIKMTFPELKREILALNPSVLSTAQLQSLMDMWPDLKEQETIDNFDGDESRIGKAEQFLIEVRSIPRFKEKMACLVFKQDFQNRVYELRESINLVIRGVNQVCASQALQQVFIYILQTGNLLNFGGDADGAASIGGFSLASLVKLNQTKAFVGGITFLQHIVQSIERDLPELACFATQINLVEKCSKVSIASLFAEKRSLEDGLRMLYHEAQAVIPAEGGDPDAELGASILKHFAAEVDREVEAIGYLLDDMGAARERFLAYFEEEESSEELDVLMTYIANFCSEYQRERSKYLENQARQKPTEQKKTAADTAPPRQRGATLQTRQRLSQSARQDRIPAHPA